jgi:hypothetical protein
MAKETPITRSFDEIKASAARYPSKAAWLRGDPSAYHAAKRQGLFGEVCGHMPRTPRKLTLEDLIASAAPHQTRNAWQKADQSAYLCALKRGLLDVVCAHMQQQPHPAGYWTLERCQASAAGYPRRTAWQRGDPQAYQAARRNGWLDLCCAQMPKYQRPPRKWTPEKIAASAKRFSSKNDWHREQHGAYHAAKRLGLFEEVTAHMTGERREDGLGVAEQD